MIKTRIPITCCMTGLTRCWKSRRGMIRIVSRVIIRAMTGKAHRWSAVKLAVCMTLLTARANVGSRQRESGRGMIEC